MLKENFTWFSENYSCVAFCSFLPLHFKSHALYLATTRTLPFTFVGNIHPWIQISDFLCSCVLVGSAMRRQMNKRSTQVDPGSKGWDQMQASQRIGGEGESAKRQRAVGFINWTAFLDSSPWMQTQMTKQMTFSVRSSNCPPQSHGSNAIWINHFNVLIIMSTYLGQNIMAGAMQIFKDEQWGSYPQKTDSLIGSERVGMEDKHEEWIGFRSHDRIQVNE